MIELINLAIPGIFNEIRESIVKDEISFNELHTNDTNPDLKMLIKKFTIKC
jgi:hypothetical protein